MPIRPWFFGDFAQSSFLRGDSAMWRHRLPDHYGEHVRADAAREDFRKKTRKEMGCRLDLESHTSTLVRLLVVTIGQELWERSQLR